MTREPEQWGEWRFRKDSGTLEHNDHDPFFDVRGISGASQAMSQIFEIVNQPWATPDAMKDLLRALNHLLDPADDYRPKNPEG